MLFVIHLALSVSRPASRTHKSECYIGAYSWSLHVMHIWYQWQESVKPVPSMSNLTDNSMDHSLYLPKTVLNALLVTATKWDTTCLIADWTTTGEQRQLLMIFTTTAQCRLKGMITPSVVRTVWKQRYTPQKQKKSGHHFIYLEDYVIKRQMNRQSGFNAEQIEKDKFRRVKPFED
jgi:hypothetical protein